ncbi:hypothetical protein [Cohnella soli]|uniref:YobI-like P-loop NTPase domain-containing protein n=1 Tax=Cohnella soli TaxID=425005 RepID=A0ABW0HZT9_9BACL
MRSNNYNFQKLTPIKNANLNIYEEALDFIFQEEDLKNIALTGPYSAGKSSVIESYISKHPNKKFINISLAHFEPTESNSVNADGSNSGSRETPNSESSVEGKILNHLIHQINADRIPQSQFKVKRKISHIKVLVASLLFTLGALLLIYIFGFNDWKSFVGNLTSSWLKSRLDFTINNSSLLVAGAFSTVIFIYTLYGLIKIQYNRNVFRKISLQGNEIEIFADADESFFDKYLNEVLYLFNNADKDIIIFEDIDRFNNNQIFEKLREINLLINKTSSNTIRFFYLIRDDIFTSKDRTKFFDFIIPIVPVVDGSNSYDQFVAHFKKGDIFNDFEESFLQGLSLYIDDMRILKNIYNEYVIYHARIQSTELNCNKLLAIVTYKNIFPRDFSELQIGRGFVYNLFENKSNVVASEINNLDIEILEKEKHIQKAESELCNDIYELDAIYFIGPRALDVDGKYEDQFASRAAFIKAMKDNPGNVYYQIQNGYRYQFDFQTEYDSLLQRTEYIERKKAIEIKSSATLDKLKRAISELLHKKVILKSAKLSELITRENVNNIFDITYNNVVGEEFSYSDVKSNPYFPLIKFLTRNGYIDETYPDYMTYFYEHSLSRADKIFLRSVTDELAKDFSYQIKDPILVTSRLRDVHFEKEEILNFDLFAHLLRTGHDYLQTFISQLKKNSRLDFIEQFWSTEREKPNLIKSLNHAWPFLWESILKGSHFSEIQKQNYALATIYYSSEEDLSALNTENSMTTYISNNGSFLNIDEPNTPIIISKLNLLKVKFKEIDYNNASPSLFHAVYENELYQLNIYMITLILNKIYNFPATEDFKHKNFTLVLSQLQEPLVAYIRNNVQQYIRVILDYCDSIITDDETVALEIINHSNIDTNHKLTYIAYLRTIIDKLDSVDDHELWPDVLQNRIVQYTEHNILQYYINTANELDDVLIEFINGNPANLNCDYVRIKDNFGESIASALFKSIVLCEGLSDDKYNVLLKDFNRRYKKFSFSGISDNKLKLLIDNSVISMNKDNLNFMRENYHTQLMDFISLNITLYVTEVIDGENFEITELLSLLEKDIKESYKLSLLDFTTEPISMRGKGYSEEIKLRILKHNFDIGDISYLINNYNRESSIVRTMIRTISEENIEQVIEEKCDVPYSLLIELLESVDIAVECKKELLIARLINLNETQAVTCFEKLGMNEIITLFSGKWPKLKRNVVNEKILSIFKSKRWISDFVIDSRETHYFRARGRKTRETVLPTELL